jgi:hypothetical protein
MSRSLAAALLLAASPAAAFDHLAVLAVADAPAGPDADLAELTHQLRAACRDRIGGVEEVATMRARMLGQRSNATLTELERAYGGALAVYQNGEFESAIRTLKAIVEDLEALPESDEAYSQWVRAQLRLAHAALTIGREKEADDAMAAVVRTDASVQPDIDLYAPAYRRRFEGWRAKVRSLPARRLHVVSEGYGGTVYVNGRAMGTTPVVLTLPAGVYRVGGSSGSLHVPSLRVDLTQEERTVVLDFALADALRVNAGPGLALGVNRRPEGIVHSGAWLDVDRVIAVTRVKEGEAQFLLGSIYDVRNGALLREGSVRMVAGTVPSANIAALAGFLLTGQSSRDVRDRTDEARAAAPPPPPIPVAALPLRPAPPAAPAAAATAGAGTVTAKPASSSSQRVASVPLPPAPAGTTLTSRADAPKASAGAPDLSVSRTFAPQPRAAPAAADPSAPARTGGWMRPAAYGSALIAGLFTGLAIQQGLVARQASSDASRMVGPDGALAPGADPTRYDQRRRDASGASRNAWLAGGAAVGFATVAGVLGWRSRVAPAPDGSLALRF